MGLNKQITRNDNRIIGDLFQFDAPVLINTIQKLVSAKRNIVRVFLKISFHFSKTFIYF